jgi:hypothetical protein
VNAVEAAIDRVLARHDTDDGFGRYKNDPIGFVRDVLGQRTWSGQEKILRAIAQHDWVTVRAGRRVSKTNSAAGLALWFVVTRGPGARVILTGPTSTILAKGLWREVRLLYMRSAKPLGGTAGVLPSTGIEWPDARQITGITAGDAEAFQGLAAQEIMFICDESSGVEDRIFAALMGNLAGGGKVLLIGNPTQSDGFFAESHKSTRWERLHLSSLESPNISEPDVKKHIKGLATKEWVEDMFRMWGGPDGVLYRIHVLGEFVEAREGRMFTAGMLAASEARWELEPATGRLVVGLDPAGDGGDGDASGFVCRRGMKILYADTLRGLDASAHVAHVLGMIREHRGDSTDVPLVIVDRDGLVGHRVYGALVAYLETSPRAFEVRGIRGSEHAKRKPLEIDRVRDEMWFALKDAFQVGLAIPPSVELAGDLAAIRFDKLLNGRAKVIHKKQIRRELGRSPDLGDALALCCYAEMGRGDDSLGLPDYGEDGGASGHIAGGDARGRGGDLDAFAYLNPEYDRVFDPHRGM